MFGKSQFINGVSVVYNDPDAPWPMRSRKPAAQLPTVMRRPAEPVLIVSNPDHPDRHARPRSTKYVFTDYFGRVEGAIVLDLEHGRRGSARNQGRKPRHADQRRETLRRIG
jgi:hypothetical protein